MFSEIEGGFLIICGFIGKMRAILMGLKEAEGTFVTNQCMSTRDV